MIALEGVTRHGLTEAVKAILRGALGHAFLPSPPELRLQINKIMQVYEDYEERARRRHQIAAQWIPPRIEPTPGERARVMALYEKFKADNSKEKSADVELERADIRARYGMTDEVLAGVQDNPIAKTRMGNGS